MVDLYPLSCWFGLHHFCSPRPQSHTAPWSSPMEIWGAFPETERTEVQLSCWVLGELRGCTTIDQLINDLITDLVNDSQASHDSHEVTTPRKWQHILSPCQIPSLQPFEHTEQRSWKDTVGKLMKSTFCGEVLYFPLDFPNKRTGKNSPARVAPAQASCEREEMGYPLVN